MKNFTGYKWWEHKNPAFKQACFNKALKETVELKKQYDYFIKHTKLNY